MDIALISETIDPSPFHFFEVAQGDKGNSSSVASDTGKNYLSSELYSRAGSDLGSYPIPLTYTMVHELGSIEVEQRTKI